MEHALYAPGGFYRRGEAPAAHFRTSVHASPLYAAALLRLARETGSTTVVDVGAGRGKLLGQLHAADPSLRLVGVDVATRPPELGTAIAWMASVPDLPGRTLVVANELLDNVPVDVVQVDAAGVARLVEVEVSTGRERLGGQPTVRDAAWLAEWWPLGEAPAGARAEVGWPRDERWSQLVSALQSEGGGAAVAVDYTHPRASRPLAGTLSAYRAGRLVEPVPDGSCDLTAHVALDSCAAAGLAAGADHTLQLTQQAALTALGVRARRPAAEAASEDPAGYLRALAGAGEAAELLDAGELGAFGWLVQTVRTPLPASLGKERELTPES